jgi:hypothetical protein
MQRKILFLIYPFVFLGLQPITRGQEIVLPAGTLLHCTFNEPNFSSATSEVGDPVLCHAEAIQQFGRAVFPRGTYLAGHLEGYKDPGHFFGKGWLQVEFDRIGLPNADLPVPAKIIAIRGYRADREGKIRGHGHARRDTVEWMLPPLWPWKVLMLPARGPRPALKGEVPVTLRLMQDVTVPQATASVSPPTSRRSAAPSFATPKSALSLKYLPPTVPAPHTGATASRTDASWRPFGKESNSVHERRPPELTLIALKSETIYAVTDYWLADGRLTCLRSSGAQQTLDLNEVDWGKTTQLNAERGVTITLRSSRQPSY